MRRRQTVFVALTLVISCSAFRLPSFVFAAQQTQAPTFRSGIDVVELNVAVTDGRRVITNLAAEDFKVVDNGVEQKVLSVSRETLPIDVTILLDTSESVSVPLLEAMVNGAQRIRGRLRPDDRVSILTFSHRIRERVALSVPGVISKIELGRPAGQTSLNDAIAIVLAQPPAIDRRQMMIVFTDGRDSTSILSESEVLAVAGRSNTAVFGISRTGASRTAASQVLLLQAGSSISFFDLLAGVTGGAVQHVPLFSFSTPLAGQMSIKPNLNLLEEPFLKALDDFRSSYVLRYNLTGVPRAGWHEVAVTVPGRKNYAIRTRTGYAG